MQNSDNLMKIGYNETYKEVMTFWIFAMFIKHFLNARYEYAYKIIDVIASQFSLILIARMILKIHIWESE